MQAAEKAVVPAGRGDRPARSTRNWCRKILALNDPFQEVRSHIGALTYQIEITNSESSKDSLRKRDRRAEERRPTRSSCPADGTEKRTMKFDEMDKQLQDWKDEKAELLQQRVDLMKKATDLRAQRDKYLSDRIPDASTDTLDRRAELAGRTSTSASARSTSRMSTWWTAANPATWARASR